MRRTLAKPERWLLKLGVVAMFTVLCICAAGVILFAVLTAIYLPMPTRL